MEGSCGISRGAIIGNVRGRVGGLNAAVAIEVLGRKTGCCCGYPCGVFSRVLERRLVVDRAANTKAWGMLLC